MSRSIALLPFEVSRWAPEPVLLDEDDDAALDEEALDEAPQGEAPLDEAPQDDDGPPPDGSPDGPAMEGALTEGAAEGEGAAAADEAPAIDAAGDGATPEEGPAREPPLEESADAAGPDAAEPASGEASADAGALGYLGHSEASEASKASETSEATSKASETSQAGAASKASETSQAGEPAEADGAGAGATDGALEEDEGPGEEWPEDDAAAASADAEPHAWLARADRVALARWIREELALLLWRAEVLAPVLVELDGEAEAGAEELDDLELPLTAESGAAAAVASNTELALCCRLRADADAVELSGLLADATADERVRFTLGAPLGAAHLIPLRAAHELLLALGEDAAEAALPEVPEDGEELPADAVLALCRGASALAEARRAPPGDPLADPLPALGALLEALALAPELLAARDLLLRGAEEAQGGAAMPTWLGALEQLELALPGDVPTLTMLASYRRLHHDLDGARDLLLRARDLATAGLEEAMVLDQLAALAEQEGRVEEAVQHLRAATRLADDPQLHLRLGLLLRERDPQEAARSLQRAVVLAPDAARTRLELARQLALLGESGRAATEAARAAQLARAAPELAEEAAALLRELIN